MKFKHIFWLFSALVFVVTSAAGIAVLIDRFVTRKESPDGYVECVEEIDSEE